MSGKNSFFITKIKRQRYNSIYIVVFSAIAAFAVIGGFLFLIELRNGLGGMEKRLGADLMVVPADCESTAEDILMEGSREYFYFDDSVKDEISKIDGIEKVTSQFYLASLAADCCTSPVAIVGFDPDTDFIVWPWVSERDRKKIKDGMVVVGNDIKLEADGSIRLFGQEYSVGARLAETDTSLDTSVYLTMDSLPKLIQNAEEQGMFFLDRQKNANAISSIFVKIGNGVSQQEIAKDISKVSGEKVDIVFTKDILYSFAENTKQIIYSICTLVCVILFVVECLFVIICHVSSEKKTKEYALLHIMGISRKQLLVLQTKETLLLTFFGFVGGILGAMIIIAPFGRYFAKQLNCGYIQPTVAETILIIGISGIISIFMAVSGSVLPVVKVVKKDAYTALREEE